MVNRETGPIIKNLSRVIFPEYELIELDNGIPVYLIPGKTNQALKIDFLFKSGRTSELKKSVSKICHTLMREGTLTLSAKDIADHLDYYGATLRAVAGMDFCGFTTYVLNKHLPKVLPTILDIISNPIFDNKELETKKNQLIDNLEYELSKNEVVAYRLLTEDLFGSDHPYGYNTIAESIRSINTENIKRHHLTNYSASTLKIFVSGDINQEVITQIESCSALKRTESSTYTISEVNSMKGCTTEIGKNPFQSAIRLGKTLFTRDHPDFIDSFIYNTILGGYFGSRLMQSIRENKGYTYGVYSTVEHFLYAGFFSISTEVDNVHVNETLKSIKVEMDRLQNELVSNRELSMVRNYLLGNLMNLKDGPFKSANLIKSFMADDCGKEGFEETVDRIINIDAEAIQRVAERHFDFQELNVSLVGNKS